MAKSIKMYANGQFFANTFTEGGSQLNNALTMKEYANGNVQILNIQELISPVIVNISQNCTCQAIGKDGVPVPAPGIGSSYYLSSNVLGSSIIWSSLPFYFVPTGVNNAVNNTPISLPAGHFSQIYMLGFAANGGNQPAQNVVITYTDGSNTTIVQGFSDWSGPQGYSGESTTLTMSYRDTPTGAENAGPWYLYGYSFSLNGAKTTANIAIPTSQYVYTFALDLIPAPQPMRLFANGSFFANSFSEF